MKYFITWAGPMRSGTAIPREKNGGNVMKNLKIRIKLMEYNKRLWWLAMILETSEATLSRRLRNELPEEEQQKIIQIIEEKVGEKA